VKIREVPAPHDVPFMIAQGPVEGPTSYVDASVNALAYALASAGVKSATVERVVRGAAERNARPPRPPDVISSLIFDAFLRANRDRNAELARRRAVAVKYGGEYEPPSPRDRVLEALDALLRAQMHGFVFDRDTVELDAVWSETGAALHMPLGGEARDLQRHVVEQLGALANFAASAHDKAKKNDVVAALLEIARTAPKREKASEDSEAVQLIDAILQMRIWRAVGGKGDEQTLTRGDSGNEQRPDPRANVAMRVVDLNGIHPSDGVAVWTDRETQRRLLVVQFSALAGKLVAPQFRQKRASQLRDLFLRAPGALPGYYSPRPVRDAFRTARTYAVDLNEFERLVSERLAVNSTPQDSAGSDSADSGDSTDSGDASAANRAGNRAFSLESFPVVSAPKTIPAEPQVDMFEEVPDPPGPVASFRAEKTMPENTSDYRDVGDVESLASVESAPF
jgi:hypothetical protein